MPTSSPSTGRSIWAVVAGFLANVVLSLATDQVFHVLDVYPAWGVRMADNLFVIALAYRLVYGVFSGWLTARLSPQDPMKHAMILGVVGTVMGAIGALATGGRDLGPAWYSWGLAASAIPTCWLGGWLRGRAREAA